MTDFYIKTSSLFSEIGVDGSLLNYWSRPTITKTRFLAENNQQVLRLDVEDSHPINEMDEDRLLSKLKEIIDLFDVVVLSDYMKGLLTPRFTQGVISISNHHGKRVFVDVKDTNFNKYKGAWLLKPASWSDHVALSDSASAAKRPYTY